MTNDSDSNKLTALLGSTQQLRTHWSGLIINIMYFAIVANVAVWTFFIQSYIGYFNEAKTWDHSYIAIASTISLGLLVLWRWYTRHLFNGIAALYPELIYFEAKLSCPPQYGTSGYLKRNLGDRGGFLQSNLSAENKAEVISQLVEKKLIGGHGHCVLNWLTLAAMLGLVWIVFSLGIFGFWHIGYGALEQGIVRPDLKWLFGIYSIVALSGMVALMATWQRKPCKTQVDNIINNVTIPIKDEPKRE